MKSVVRISLVALLLAGFAAPASAAPTMAAASTPWECPMVAVGRTARSR